MPDTAIVLRELPDAISSVRQCLRAAAAIHRPANVAPGSITMRFVLPLAKNAALNLPSTRVALTAVAPPPAKAVMAGEIAPTRA